MNHKKYSLAPKTKRYYTKYQIRRKIVMNWPLPNSQQARKFKKIMSILCQSLMNKMTTTLRFQAIYLEMRMQAVLQGPITIKNQLNRMWRRMTKTSMLMMRSKRNSNQLDMRKNNSKRCSRKE